jgi:Ca2+-binding EF-hand superfamily protein
MRNRKLVVLLGCMALAPLAAMASDTPPAAPEATPPATQSGPVGHFAALDTNGDGAISLAEAQAGAPRMAEHFTEIDANGDGLITKEEMQAARGKLRQEMQARGEERFRSADADGDGKIDLAEAQTSMPRAAEHFGEIDANGDGFLTHDELRAYMQAHRGEGKWAGKQKPAAVQPQ